MGNEGLLFERDGETSAISTALSAASTGSGSVLVIQGRAGIGKSRLLDFARDAADRGMTTLSAQGAEIETAFAFGVVKQLFDAQVRDSQIRGADLSRAPRSKRHRSSDSARFPMATARSRFYTACTG